MKIPSLLVQNQERMESEQNILNELFKQKNEIECYINNYLPLDIQFLISIDSSNILQNSITALKYKEHILQLPTHFLKQLSPNNIPEKLSEHVDRIIKIDSQLNSL